MNDDKKDSSDITRIEDLSDFIHDEDEEDISLTSEEDNLLEMEKESFGENTSFMEIPEEFDDHSSEVTQNFDEESFDSFDQPDFDEVHNSGEDSNLSDDKFEFQDFEDQIFESFNEDAQENLSEDAQQDLQDHSSVEENTLDPDPEPNLQDLDQEANFSKENISKESSPLGKKELEPSKNEINDIREFALNSHDLSIEGNPPFSIILKDLKYQEDADQILDILKSSKIVNENNEQSTKEALNRGEILIPRLGEYNAIILCHKLREFDVDLSMGLSEQIHSPSTSELIDRGLTTRSSIESNIKTYQSFNCDDISIEDIQVTNLNTFENYEIVKNLCVKSKSRPVKNHLLNSENFNKNYDILVSEIIEELKEEAIKVDANALINLNTSLVPLPGNKEEINIFCTANIVRITKK